MIHFVCAQHQILPFVLSTPLTATLAVAAVAVWVALYRLVRVSAPLARVALSAARVAVGFCAILCVMAWVGRGLVFATNWPLWPLALGGAVCVEALLLLYALERQIVSRRVGFTLAALRVAIALLIIAMLAQPMRAVDFTRTLERYVAVLIDHSASMHVPDKQMNPSEKVRLAEALSDDAPHRPVRLEEAGAGLDDLSDALSQQIDWVAKLHEADAETRLEQLHAHGDTAQEALEELEGKVKALAEAVTRALANAGAIDAEARQALETLRGEIAGNVGSPLAKAAEMLDSDGLPQLGRDSGPLLALLRAASASLAKAEPRLHASAAALDTAFYAALSPEERAKVDAFAHKKRLALARAVLTHRPVERPGSSDTRPSLLEELTDRYGEAVRFYTFASKASEVTIEEGLVPANGDTGELPEALQETDLAAALEKVASEMPADRLAGVVLLTDGRHNGPGAIEAMGRRMGLQRVPIASVLFGGSARPTTDAAVVALDAPETVYAKDKVHLNAEIKLDGLKGKDVRVTLYDGDKPVDSEEIHVETDKLRTRIQLSDEPQDTGLHAYRVKIEETEGEVLAENNEFPLSVSVTDDQTRFLIVG
ncbi:hypothetical protein HQ560_13185, partial [bacterium]|nr:hypothetical protein [bacterium]